MNPQCVIAAVDLDRKAETTVRRAANLANLCQAVLLVVHVVDESGAETGYSPCISPNQVRQETALSAGAWLRGLLQHVGAGQSEIVVPRGRMQAEIVRLADERRAAYVVTGQSRWGMLGKIVGLEQRLQSVKPHCQLFGTGTPQTGIAMPGIEMPLRGGA